MKTLRQRFEDKYVPEPMSGCWLWTAHIEPTGYGKIGSAPPRRTMLYAHRVSYELHVGPIPEGKVIDHLCRNRACCNPAHLRVVTHAENVACGSRPMRTHCNHGHLFSPENTSMHHGYRRCKECHRQQERVKRI